MELIVAMTIFLILAALAVTGYQTIGRQISRMSCINNMRNIHVSLSTYLTDRGHWPQIPTTLADDLSGYETWWITELEPYGSEKKSWLCPVLSKSRIQFDGYPLRMHYIPTDFDANPMSPRRWSTMPWLIEQGNNHGRGSLVAFPDGSIRDSLRW